MSVPIQVGIKLLRCVAVARARSDRAFEHAIVVRIWMPPRTWQFWLVRASIGGFATGWRMRGQAGFFDVEGRLKELSAKGDALERLIAVVDFELFRGDLERAVPRSDGSKGGRPAFDHVLMFKVLVLQASHSLSDERSEYLIRDAADCTNKLERRATWQRKSGALGRRLVEVACQISLRCQLAASPPPNKAKSAEGGAEQEERSRFWYRSGILQIRERGVNTQCVGSPVIDRIGVRVETKLELGAIRKVHGLRASERCRGRVPPKGESVRNRAVARAVTCVRQGEVQAYLDSIGTVRIIIVQLKLNETGFGYVPPRRQVNI
jgi:hypothetical protein